MYDIHLSPFLIRGKYVVREKRSLPNAIVAMITDTCPDDHACCIYQRSSYIPKYIYYSSVPQIALGCKVRVKCTRKRGKVPG